MNKADRARIAQMLDSRIKTLLMSEELKRLIKSIVAQEIGVCKSCVDAKETAVLPGVEIREYGD